ncbi:MAG: thiamine phosphate synthase [Pseudomonadota bacterium]
MRRRHPVPRLWLMTDERMGDALWSALDRLPRGAGVVFRHYGLSQAERRALLARVTAIARRRGLIVLAAGGLDGKDGAHNRRPRRGLHSRSVHDRRELIAARRAGADLVFVSPVFATRSHSGGQTLGPVRLGLLIRGAERPVIALGGMTRLRARRLRCLPVHGWAGIDAWSQ